MHSSVWYTMLYNPNVHPPSNRYVPGCVIIGRCCCCCWGFEIWNERSDVVFIVVGLVVDFFDGANIALRIRGRDDTVLTMEEENIFVFCCWWCGEIGRNLVVWLIENCERWKIDVCVWFRTVVLLPPLLSFLLVVLHLWRKDTHRVLMAGVSPNLAFSRRVLLESWTWCNISKRR